MLGKQDPATRVFSSAQVWLLGCETVASQPLPQPSMLLELPTLASSRGSHRCEFTEKVKTTPLTFEHPT